MIGDGLAVEYTRDSPLFRQQISAFEETFSCFSDYCKGVVKSLQDYEKALAQIILCQKNLQSALNGNKKDSSVNYSRSLFTNTFPILGDLQDTMRSLGDFILETNKGYDKLKETITMDIIPGFQELSSYDLIYEKELYNQVIINNNIYDNLLYKLLNSSNIINDKKSEKIIKSRENYELLRFDLVKQLNLLDRKKKLKLINLSNNFFNSYENKNNNIYNIINSYKFKFNKINELYKCNDLNDKISNIWDEIRLILQSEIRGVLPPPNSPPGANSPFQPRQRIGMLLYSANLTTEVLSTGTRSATMKDLSHARDDGVFKQGFLFISKTLSVQRKWHRLYESKLYVMENSLTSPTCTLEPICDIANALISAKPGNTPNKFIIATNVGKRLEFQADNEDEMISWIYALRRCAAGAKHRNKNINELIIREGPAANLLLEFINKNNYCGECCNQPVRWVSVNLGVTLCESCSIGHRHLTWSVSKLKSLELDVFLPYQVDILLNELGNDFNILIWEASIPQGWKKPAPDSPVEEKTKWIIAKYQWYAFVEDLHIDPSKLSHGLFDSVLSNNIKDVMWWLAHRADINSRHITDNATPLHMSIENELPMMSCFLLQNGSSLSLKDSKSLTPVDLSSKKYSSSNNQNTKLIDDIILDYLQGIF